VRGGLIRTGFTVERRTAAVAAAPSARLWTLNGPRAVYMREAVLVRELVDQLSTVWRLGHEVPRR
jgi:hypothetical protein